MHSFRCVCRRSCVCSAASLRRMKIYSTSSTVRYNLCYLLHHLSPREHCIQGLMMSARLYNIKRIIWSPPRTMKWDLFNLLFILCLRVVSSQLSGDLHLSRRLFKERVCHNAVKTLLILSLSHSSLLHFCLIFLTVTFLLFLRHSFVSLSLCFRSSSLSVDGQIW